MNIDVVLGSYRAFMELGPRGTNGGLLGVQPKRQLLRSYQRRHGERRRRRLRRRGEAVLQRVDATTAAAAETRVQRRLGAGHRYRSEVGILNSTLGLYYSVWLAE